MTISYKCALCLGTFESDWTDEEANVELRENFPGSDPTDCDIVCDDCYKKILGFEEDTQHIREEAGETAQEG